MQVTGSVLRARVLFVRSIGDHALPEVLDQLDPATRDALSSGFLETRWYPYEMLIDLSETTDRVLGRGDMALCHRMGRFSCELSLTTLHRLLLKFGNLGYLVDRAATAWRTNFDAGELVVLEKQRDRYRFELRGVARPHRAHCAAITGWMVRAAELSGEDDLEHHEQCRATGGSSCTWTFTRRPLSPKN